MNGAGVIHDVELALAGKTSEDVAACLSDGSFGMAKETAQFIHGALSEGVQRPRIRRLGGEGDRVIEGALPEKEPARGGVPARRARDRPRGRRADIVHMHPEADGAAIGEGSLRDFRTFCSLVARLSGVSTSTSGRRSSSRGLPQGDLRGAQPWASLSRITTVNMDFLRQYRPDVNVVDRPRKAGERVPPDRSHEILFPLLMAAIAERRG